MIIIVLFSFLSLNIHFGNAALQLSVIHFNDFHARFLPTDIDGGSCKIHKKCVGGFSRLHKQISSMLKENPEYVILNAGDSFQGTFWYTVGKWNITSQFMNTLSIDAEVLGNHEFDNGLDGVIPYINALRHPVVVSNIDDRLEPNFRGIYTKSTIINRHGKKIGIIGVTTNECSKKSNTGNLKFLPESSSVNVEAERLVREEGVFTNIVLSHSGYPIDKEIAANASAKISLVVGGHTHTFLFTGDDPPGPAPVRGPYPTIVRSKLGHNVLVTQASYASRYLGNITIFLDEHGYILGHSGKPIFLDNSFPQDEMINKMLLSWRKTIDAEGEKIIGSTLIPLNNMGCHREECSFGNFMTDAMVFAYTVSTPESTWREVDCAVINPGGLRRDLKIGNISYNDMSTAQPFRNTIDIAKILGKHLKEMLEFSALPKQFSKLNLLQVSGMKVVYNVTRPYRERVIALKIRCQNCTSSRFEDLQLDRNYTIALPSFLSNGGGGFKFLRNYLMEKKTGPLDIDIIQDYLAKHSPISHLESGRITVIRSEKEGKRKGSKEKKL